MTDGSPLDGGGDHADPLQGVQNISIHFKILRTQDEVVANEPTMDSILQLITDQLADMRTIYGSSFTVTRLTTESLIVDDVDTDAGECMMDGALSDEQTAIFSHRNNVNENELAVYVVRTLFSGENMLNGCASHPTDEPGAIMVREPSSRWVLAHELGHVLGLGHVDDRDRLMYGSGTANITHPPPNLVGTEIRTLQDSIWTIPV